MLPIAELFDLKRLPPSLSGLFDVEVAWEALARLEELAAAATAESAGYVHPTAVVEGTLVAAAGTEVGPHAYLTGTVILLEGAKIGHGAYLRGPVVLGPDAHVGHATEVKHSILLGGAKAPHFNYVGDSILGHDVNLGAGVKLANFKTFGDEIVVEGVATGLRKLGAIVGDQASIGCNAVTAPGTIVGARTIVYHGANLRGVVPTGSIVKHRPSLEVVKRR